MEHQALNPHDKNAAILDLDALRMGSFSPFFYVHLFPSIFPSTFYLCCASFAMTQQLLRSHFLPSNCKGKYRKYPTFPTNFSLPAFVYCMGCCWIMMSKRKKEKKSLCRRFVFQVSSLVGYTQTLLLRAVNQSINVDEFWVEWQNFGHMSYIQTFHTVTLQPKRLTAPFIQLSNW